jgi:protein phosphatase
VTNVVGARARADVHLLEVSLSGGEVVLLTTDGVHGVLDDRRLEALLVSAGTPDQIAAQVVSAALDGGSRDNCTAVVLRYST